MKQLLLILLFVTTILNAQALELIYSGETPKWAIDLDGSTEYAYKNTPTGLDLNGSELITATADRDFSGAGHWDGVTVSGGVGTFTSTASLTNSNFTHFVSGHNYTIQGNFKSGASSSFKIVTDNDSSTITTTTSSVTKAFTFTYSGGSQTVQFKGVGSDTWTGDNISITEAYNLEIEGWLKPSNAASNYYLIKLNSNGYLGIFTNANTLYHRYYDGTSYVTATVAGLSSNQWTHFIANVNRELGIIDINIVGGSSSTDVSISALKKQNSFTDFSIGSASGSTYFNGEIGTITITRKDGTGAVVSYSYYKFAGNSSTFLQDSGPNANHLVGVNLTSPADQVKFKTGEYK